MADCTTGGIREHSVHIPAAHGAGQGKAAAPEKQLNRFVRAVALVERAGNALGTLAFTWATVVLLGGYPEKLYPSEDFWFAITIVFLETARMFSHDNNRADYQLFFRTRGAFRFFGWNGVVLILCVSNILAWNMTSESDGATGTGLMLSMVILVICLFLFSPLRRVISLWGPMVAILLLAPSLPYNYDDNGKLHRYIFGKSSAKWTVYLVLLLVVLLLTISRLQFPSIIKLVDCAMGSKLSSWRQDILNLCMFAAIGMSLSTFERLLQIAIIMIDMCVVLIISLGNLQFPVAVLRVVLALIRHDYISFWKNNDPGPKNLVPSLGIFYWMVLGQGILYIVACILEAFSFILRKSLVRCAGFRGKLGVEYVNLYYAYAFEKSMGGAIFARNKISLVTFAMDSLKLDSPKMQLYGVQMLHNFLQKEPFKTKAISKLITSTQAVASLFNMLGWTSEEHKYIRSFAAKVINELAYSLRVSPIRGAVQLIASLLDTVHQPEIKDPLLATDSQQAKIEALIQQVSREGGNSPVIKSWKQIVIYCLIPVEEPPTRDEHHSCMLRCLKQVTKCWSVPQEEPSMDQDLLPVLGMSIIDRLGFDLENCMEISRATGLISKVIEFTNNRTDMTNIDETHQTLMKGSSLMVLRRLASIQGKFGVTLREKISEHPFLLGNLAEILDESRSCQEHRELTVEILKNLAIDGNTKKEIGHTRGIISKLLHTFLIRDTPSTKDSDHMLQKIAGQALAILAMENANNCFVMSTEPGYVFVKELTIMIHGNRHRYIAASLLRSMCVHARSELSNLDLKELSHILREVLEGIMDAEGAELHILVGLSSQICNVIPEKFTQELEHGRMKEPFIQRLVDTLNANMIPTAHCPGIRRVIIEQAIYMMECNPSYVNCFNKYRTMEALIRVERTPSRAENYRFFLGGAGLMEHNIPLSVLVARAKKLMGS